MELDRQVWEGVFYDGPKPTSTRRRPILGFRLNRHSGEALVPLSYAGYVWKPGLNVAVCRSYPTKHHAPGPACRCGLYACHDVNALVHAVGQWGTLRPSAQPLILVGVAGTGVVRIHERGWRAQYARIVALSDEIPALVITHERGKIVVGHELIRKAPARGPYRSARTDVL